MSSFINKIEYIISHPSFDPQHLLAQRHKQFLVHPFGDSGSLHLLKLELVVRQSLQGLLASLAVDETLPLEVEQREDVDDLLFAENAGLEAYVSEGLPCFCLSLNLSIRKSLMFCGCSQHRSEHRSSMSSTMRCRRRYSSALSLRLFWVAMM